MYVVILRYRSDFIFYETLNYKKKLKFDFNSTLKTLKQLNI